MKPTFTLILLLIGLAGCASAPTPRLAEPPCPRAELKAASAPEILAHFEEPGFWLQKLNEKELQRVLMSDEAITALNARNLASNRAAYQDILGASVADPERVTSELAERRAWLDNKLSTKAYVEALPGSYALAKKVIEQSLPHDALHLVAREADIRCVPTDEGFFTPAMDLAFDRNRCSRLHVGEAVRVLRTAQQGEWLYVHAGHSVGWLHSPALAPAKTRDEMNSYLNDPNRLVLTDDILVEGVTLRMGRRFPGKRQDDGSWLLTLASEEGTRSLTLGPQSPLHQGAMPLTKANVLKLVFSRMNEPYGWGGYRGGRDCSRLLLDLFSVFGLRLGRHSLVQAEAGLAKVDISAMSVDEKRAALRQAGQRGVVLVYMPGHIMLHLGEHAGRPYALSSISEYLTPCRGGDQTHRLDRVAVSDYRVGEGTERKSFIERITKLAIFGGPE